MRKTFLCLSLIIGSIISSNAQTESETIDFINSMLSSYTAPMGNQQTKYVLQTKTDTDSAKFFVIAFTVGNDLREISVFYPQYINNVIDFRAPNGNLCLKIISSDNKILEKYTNDEQKRYESELRIVLTANDNEVNRIKKAFLHLFKINNAPLINDSLFNNN